MTAYYNEIDPFAAEWLRELIKAGHIAPGEVDTRSIEDVVPTELDGFTQCHFFAGIGVWSYALRGAGWPDDRPIWTGSCPCQPFSAAGKGKGIADERHLWPAFFHLIDNCHPVTVIGEQVASKDGLGWLDLVQADLEGAGYSCRAIDTCAAGFGAPHLRQRLYWMANSQRAEKKRQQQHSGEGICVEKPKGLAGDCGTGSLANTIGSRQCRGDKRGFGESGVEIPQQEDREDIANQSGDRREDAGSLADTERERIWTCGQVGIGGAQGEVQVINRERQRFRADFVAVPNIERSTAGPTNGQWRDADWLFCRDGKWRPVEPGTFPLAHGATNRVGRLRGYGNAIVAPQAEEIIRVFMMEIERRKR